MASVSIRGAKKRFGDVEILHGVDIEIPDGSFTVLVGPSGCGKSTLLRMIAGLEHISGGDVLIGDTRVNDMQPKQRDIAMVFQNYALYPHMTVRDNMAFSLKLRKADAAQTAKRVADAARILNLDALLDRFPRELSGGQRQRVAMGRAIVRDPKVFLFDEPLSNLDAKLRVAMRTEIKELHQRLATTSVYVTHDQIEAMTMGDQIVVMKDGRIEQKGSPLDLYDTPANQFVAGFIGSPGMNILDGTLVEADASQARVRLADASEVVCAVDASRAKAGDAVKLGVRPEHLDAASQENRLAAKVTFVERLGGSAHAYCAFGPADDTLTCALADEAAAARVRAGQTLDLGFPASVAYLFDANGKAFARHAAAEFKQTA